MCNRPYSDVHQMHEALIYNWNSKIRNKKEQIYILGDLSFGGFQATKELVSKLNGYKHFVLGNHDGSAKKMLEMGFDQVFENDFLKIGDKRVLLSHYPYHPVNKYEVTDGQVVAQDVSYDNDRRYLHKRILDDGKTFLLHGHVHTAWKQKGRQINVGVDVWGMGPVNQDKILKLINAGPNDIDVKNHGEYEDDN